MVALLAVLAGARTAAAAPVGSAAPGAAAAAPAGASTTTDPAKAAAGYLARSLVGGTHYVFDFDGKTPDLGLTAEGVFGMAAAKVSGSAITAATDYLAANAASYIDTADSFGGPFPGAYAKLALVAEATGRNPHAFGSLNLLHNLAALECPPSGRTDCAADEVGLFKSTSKTVSPVNVVVQSLAIIALARSSVAGEHPDAAAINYLVGRQCPNGGFPSLPAATGPCVSDVDGTAYAAQALVLAGRAGPAGRALGWLESVRLPDGSFPSADRVANSNSTAVAVQALLAGRRNAASSIAWLRGKQVGCRGPAAQRGAVTFAGTFDKTALRATTQAAEALGRSPLTTLTAAGASTGAPVLACAAPPTPTPTPAPTSPASVPTATPPPGNAAPPPSLAATNAVNGSAVRVLAGVGAGLVLAGAAALLLVRRRA